MPGRFQAAARCRTSARAPLAWQSDAGESALFSQRGAFEEYRYDALGRRVLVRSRQSWICQSRCQNVTRRVIWDGDQLLAEIQAPGQDSSFGAMEQDRGFRQPAASSVTAPDTSLAGSVVSPTAAYPGFYFGRVVYVHGGGIDHPLAIERMEYSDSLPGPYTIYPHENWKGAFDLGSYDGGSLNPPCKLLSDAVTASIRLRPSKPIGEERATGQDVAPLADAAFSAGALVGSARAACVLHPITPRGAT